MYLFPELFLTLILQVAIMTQYASKKMTVSTEIWNKYVTENENKLKLDTKALLINHPAELLQKSIKSQTVLVNHMSIISLYIV